MTGPGRWETDHHIARLIRPSEHGGTGPAQWQVYAKDEDGGEGEWQQSYPTRSEAQAAIRRMEAPAEESPAPDKPIRVLPVQMRTGDRFPDGAVYLTHSYTTNGPVADVRNPDGSTGRRKLNGNVKYDMSRATPTEGPSEPQGATGTPSGGAGTGGALPGAPEATKALHQAVNIQHDLGTPVEQWEDHDQRILNAVHQAGLSPDDARGLTIKVNRHPPNGRTGGYDRTNDTIHMHPDYLNDGYSLLHELGHRDSARQDLDHANYSTPEQIQAEERHADRFAADHGANMSAEAAKAHVEAHMIDTPAATEGPEKPYVVITQHGPEREVRRTGFDTYDQAKAWMDANNPDTDGSMVPNIDPAYLSHPNYESGGFYAKTNRYAAIHHNPPVEPPPADPVVPHVRFDGIAPAPKRLNRDKVMDRYGIRVTHKQIPPESPYHLAATDGFYPSGGVRLIHKRGGVHGRDDVSSEPDINNLQPVTVTPQDLHNMQRYSDLIDRNTGETRAFMGYDPESDMVFTEDPENGNEEWVPRKQLIAKHLPNDPYMYRVQPEGPIKDGIYRHGEIE